MPLRTTAPVIICALAALLAAPAQAQHRGIRPVTPWGGAPPDPLRVRPFITDDARVVGHGLAQLETWFRLDKETWQQWLLVALGPTPWLEVTAGGVIGEDRTRTANRFSYGLPLVQAKLLLHPYGRNALPGVALVGGTFFAAGDGPLSPEGHGSFAFAIATKQLGADEQVLLHVNAGVNHLWINRPNRTVATWGIGSQFRVVGGLHGVAELFSGDPYVPGTGAAVQAGVRHFISQDVQVDGTVGYGLSGSPRLPFWGSVGLRVVFPRLWGAPPTAERRATPPVHGPSGRLLSAPPPVRAAP